MNTEISIVMYHYVRPIKDSKYPGIKGLELVDFKRQLEFFANNYQVITMEQAVDSLYRKAELPEKAMLLTFDDGYADHYEYVYPLLKQMNMQGSFFIPSSVVRDKKVLDVNKVHYILAVSEITRLIEEVFAVLDKYRKKGYNIEQNYVLFEKLAVANRWDSKEIIFVKRLLQNYLPELIRNEIVDKLFVEKVGVPESHFSEKLYVNMEQVLEMKANGMYFGIHGDGHYWLNHLVEEDMKKDIDYSLEFFKYVVDKEYLVMNYPYGGYNDAVADYARSIGCKAGLTVEARVAHIKKDKKMLLPRLDTNDFR